MIQVVSDVGEFLGVSEEWNCLAARFPTPLLRHEWFAACVQAVCPPGRLCALLVRDGGVLRAAAALAIIKHDGRDTVEIVGSSLLYEPTGFIYSDEHSLHLLAEALRELNHPVVLKRLPAGSPQLAALAAANRGRTFFFPRSAPGSPWLPITGSWPEFETALSSKRRYDLKRACRRAQAFGEVEFQVLAPPVAAVDGCMEEIMAVEASGRKGRAGTAIACDPQIRRFFQLYARSAAECDLLRLSLLRMNGKIIAFQLLVEHSRRLWMLKIGYDAAYARCSPGILLTHETVRYAFESGLEAVEFLGTEEPWIRMWTGQAHPYVSSRIYPLSLRALVAMGADISRSVIRGKPTCDKCISG